ncbi:GNAT family N-acetyltransferase [Spirosoma sp. 209]|uniref:GNAT family N-acetyltransferase n=1 Tax=Spirosoma sp. 209 TaxID=1955701 RepID=UPI00098CFFAC|nr:GNAT family N-acetyltransferase [Spirosoma sp. 209]
MITDYTISTDKSRLNVPLIREFLSQQSYWAKNIPLDIVERSIANSLCFGVYQHGQQVGFARVITDQATFAYLSDVFILPEHRGKGLSKWLVQTISDWPELQGLRRWMLATRDAHSLYEQFGFRAIDNPDFFMQRKLIETY